jgi:hypothetical protein
MILKDYDEIKFKCNNNDDEMSPASTKCSN